MAEKDAKLRLEIEPMFTGTARGAISNLRGQLRGIAGEARGIGQQFGRNFLANMGENSKGLVPGMMDHAKGAAGTVLGLAGAYGMMDMTRRTIETEEAFRKLSSAIKLGTGQTVTWQDIQKKAGAVTKDWNHQTIDVANAMQTLQDASGNYEFAAGQINTVAIAARASGQPLEKMAGLAGDLNEKFGIAGDEMQSALSNVLSMANKGGMTFDDLSGSLGKIGASAKLAGLQGEEGLKRILALSNIAEGETGGLKQAVSGVDSLVEGIAAGGFQKNALRQGIDIQARLKKGASFEDVLTDIVAKTGGDKKKLSDIVGEGPQLQVMTALGKIFSEAAKGPGGVKDGTAAVKEAFEEAGRSATNWSEVVSLAAEGLDSKQAKLDRAMNKLEESFRSDAVSNAIDKVADIVPQLSGAIGSAIEFAAANPAGALGAYGGLKFGMGALEGAGSAAGKTLLERYGPGGALALGARFGGIAAMPFLMEGDTAQPQTPDDYDALLQEYARGKATPEMLAKIDEGFTTEDGLFRRFDTESQRMTNVRRMKGKGARGLVEGLVGGMEWYAQMAAGRSAGMTDLEAELIGIAEAPMLGGIQERALSHRKDLDRPKTWTSVGGGGMNAEQRALYDAMMRAGDKLDGTLQVQVVGPVTMYSPTLPGTGADKPYP